MQQLHFYVRVDRFLWREAIHSFPPPTKVHRQVMTSYIRCIKQRVILLRRDMTRHIHFRCSIITWSRASNSFSSICRMLSIDEIYGHMAAELCFNHKVADVDKYIYYVIRKLPSPHMRFFLNRMYSQFHVRSVGLMHL